MEDPTFFANPAVWRRWLERSHTQELEIWVGFYKVKFGSKSMTWPEAVDEALCFGWIDGLRKTIDDTSYKIRFTPRKATSIWSAVNVRRVGELTTLGRMTLAGEEAFAKRKPEKTGIYGHERETPAELDPAWNARFRNNAKAWAYFSSQAPWYQRTAIHWVMSAKKEETRLRRFEQLLIDSANERTIGPLTRPR